MSGYLKSPIFRAVPPGTPLYHGSHCEGTFDVPDGPAWFAWSFEKASDWSGWSLNPPEGRVRGERRVFAYEVFAATDLVVVEAIEQWQSLCQSLCGDPDATTYQLASAFVKNGLTGWISTREVMLLNPGDTLRLVEVTAVRSVETSRFPAFS